MKILITGGGSEEPIDNVRCVTNFSTGKTASFLADYFCSHGCEVTAIMAEKANKPCQNAKIIPYKTFAQLKNALETECKSGVYDVVIQAAAVSDYSPSRIIVDGMEFEAGKVAKLPAGSELTIKMKKNPKLLDSLKTWTAGRSKIIGFKLTSNATIDERIAAVKKIFSSNEDSNLSPDFIVSNDLSEITEFQHPCVIYNRDLSVFAKAGNLQELAGCLIKIFG